jgi:hypothetical protein
MIFKELCADVTQICRVFYIPKENYFSDNAYNILISPEREEASI